jgi:hypothetical protein
MTTTPSYVTFGLKIVLFVFECIKYKYSYDMGPIYKKLKDAYMDAESSALPSSKMMNPTGHSLKDIVEAKKQTKSQADGSGEAEEAEESKEGQG